jgi:hypothetical protein
MTLFADDNLRLAMGEVHFNPRHFMFYGAHLGLVLFEGSIPRQDMTTSASCSIDSDSRSLTALRPMERSVLFARGNPL